MSKSNFQRTSSDNDELSQQTVEVIHKFTEAGVPPEIISISLGISLEKVTQTLSQANSVILFSHIIKKFDKKSKKLRCAITGNLMQKPVRGPDDKLFEKRALTTSLISDPQKFDKTRIALIPALVENIQKLCKKTLGNVIPLLTKEQIPEQVAIIVAECLSSLKLKSDLELFLRVFATDNEPYLELLLNKFSELSSPRMLQDLLEEFSGIEQNQLASMLIIRRFVRQENPQLDFDQLLRVLCSAAMKPTALNLLTELADHLTKIQLLSCIGALNLHKRDGITDQKIIELGLKATAEDRRDQQQSKLTLKEQLRAANYYSQGINAYISYNFDKAEKKFRKCLSVHQEILPPNHLDLANIYYFLGITLHRKGTYGEAEEMEMNCLRIRQEILSPNHLDLASIYKSLGDTLNSKGSLEKGEEMKRKYQSIIQEANLAQPQDIKL